MRLAPLALVALTLLGAGRASARPHDKGRPDARPASRQSRVERGLLRAVPVEGERLTLADRMRHYAVPALSVAVWKGGRIEWAGGYGDANADTLFQAGPISRSLAAVATLRVLARHEIPLTADINAHLRTWQLPPAANRQPPTIEQILNHTARLNVPDFPGFEQGERIPSLLEELEGRGNTQALRVVGDTPSSGGGYLLLQQLLIDLEKKPIDDILEAEVLRPANMRDSTFVQPLPPPWARRAASGTREDGEPIPGGSYVFPEKTAAGLWTTAADLARFAIALQRHRLLPRAATKHMLEKNLGVQPFGRHYFVQEGGNAGFFAMYLAHRTRPEGVAVLASHEGAGPLVREIVRGVAAEYGWPDIALEPRRIVSVDPSMFAGRYRVDPDDVVRFRASGSQLILTRTGVLGERRLDAVSENEFADRDSGTFYVFSGDGVTFGAVTATRTREAIPAEVLERDPPTGVLEYDRIPAQYRTEERLRARGLTFLEQKNYGAALAILKMNAQRHPGSAAAHDALATAQLATGDLAGARQSSQRVLEALANDWTAPASSRQLYRKRAERRLQ